MECLLPLIMAELIDRMTRETLGLILKLGGALIFLALLPILAVVLIGISLYVSPIFQRILRKYDALNNSVQENVSAIRVVKSFVREDYEKEKFGRTLGMEASASSGESRHAELC